MKKIIFITLFFISLNAMAANQTIPNDRKITGINIYADLIVVKFTPAFQNSQGCTSPSTSEVQLMLADDPSKAMFSAILAAAASKSSIGFGIGGCAGQHPKIYRVDPKY